MTLTQSRNLPLKIRWIGLLCLTALVTLIAPSTFAEEHGLSPKAGEVGRVYGFPITDSMLVCWIVALALIVFVRAATRRIKQIPDGAQNFLEWIVESLYALLEGIL